MRRGLAVSLGSVSSEHVGMHRCRQHKRICDAGIAPPRVSWALRARRGAEEGAEEGVLVDLVIPADVLLLLSLDVSRCCVLWMRLGTPSSLCS